jgi:hypothetical protein
MATLRSDIIIPFLASGVVQPMAELNATEDGGDYVSTSLFSRLT